MHEEAQLSEARSRLQNQTYENDRDPLNQTHADHSDHLRDLDWNLFLPHTVWQAQVWQIVWARASIRKGTSQNRTEEDPEYVIP
jgi:hypothetical protein